MNSTQEPGSLNLLGQLGEWLLVKRNFIAYFMVCGGLVFSIVSIWMLGRHAGLAFSLFLISVSFASSYLSGLLLWELFMKSFAFRKNKAAKAPK